MFIPMMVLHYSFAFLFENWQVEKYRLERVARHSSLSYKNEFYKIGLFETFFQIFKKFGYFDF